MLRADSRVRASCAFVLAALTCLFTPVAAPADSNPRPLAERLQSGGYVLYVRHFATDHAKDDTDPFHLENVAAQRRLTDAGRKQATAAGEALRSLAIPFERVVCSQFDRARESARLIGVGEPAATADVSAPASARNEEEKQRRANVLRALLSTPPASGKNTLIVSHNSNLREAAGEEFASLREGEIVVFQPVGGSFRAVGRVYPSWDRSAWSARAP